MATKLLWLSLNSFIRLIQCCLDIVFGMIYSGVKVNTDYIKLVEPVWSLTDVQLWINHEWPVQNLLLQSVDKTTNVCIAQAWFIFMLKLL